MTGWRFLLDENVDPKAATYLEKEDVSAEHVRETLGEEQTTKKIFCPTHGNNTS